MCQQAGGCRATVKARSTTSAGHNVERLALTCHCPFDCHGRLSPFASPAHESEWSQVPRFSSVRLNLFLCRQKLRPLSHDFDEAECLDLRRMHHKLLSCSRSRLLLGMWCPGAGSQPTVVLFEASDGRPSSPHRSLPLTLADWALCCRCRTQRGEDTHLVSQANSDRNSPHSLRTTLPTKPPEAKWFSAASYSSSTNTRSITGCI